MKHCLFAITLLCGSRVSMTPYWTAAGTASLLTAADFVTATSLEFHGRGCEFEVGTAWLYGRTPQYDRARTGFLMFGELALTGTASYLLRKHRSRFWLVPLGYSAIAHGQAAARNFYFC